MTDTIARLRKGKKIFETMVDLENSLKLKRGEDIDINEVISDVAIYKDLKKGMQASRDDLMEAFQTTDFPTIVREIVKKGEIEIKKEFRDQEIEKKKKRIIDFLVRNAIDARTNRPFTPEVIDSAIEEAGLNLQQLTIEKHLNEIIEKLQKIIPIKIATKRIRMIIPAEYTAHVYGLVHHYQEKEEWKDNGNLEVILRIPVGLQMELYDKINKLTHGSIITEELE